MVENIKIYELRVMVENIKLYELPFRQHVFFDRRV